MKGTTMILSFSDWFEEFDRIRVIAKEVAYIADVPTLEEKYRLGKYPAEAFNEVRGERDRWIAERNAERAQIAK